MRTSSRAYYVPAVFRYGHMRSVFYIFREVMEHLCPHSQIHWDFKKQKPYKHTKTIQEIYVIVLVYIIFFSLNLPSYTGSERFAWPQRVSWPRRTARKYSKSSLRRPPTTYDVLLLQQCQILISLGSFWSWWASWSKGKHGKKYSHFLHTKEKFKKSHCLGSLFCFFIKCCITHM